MSDDTEEVVKVLYDYKYSDDTGQVEIKAGDIYRLVEKTNNEWWQVYDPSDENGEFFFVPAQYVKIVSEKSPWKALSDLDKLLTFGVTSDTSENLSETEEDADNSTDSVFKVANESNGLEPKKQYQEESMEADYANVPCKPLDLRDDGEYVNLDQFRDAAGIPILKVDGDLGCNEIISSSITSTDLPEASQELIHGSVPPPLPGEGKFIRVLMKDQPWDIYKENVLGRLYFVNRETGERAWKPPRKATSPLDQLNPVPPLQAVKLPEISAPTSTGSSSVQIKEDWTGIPSEYEQVHENGSVYFIHKATQEKWKTLVDKVGRQYFHKLGSSDTQWKLPTAPEVTDKENLLRTSEFPVQHRDHRWEPVGHRLSTFGGQSVRDNRAKSTYGQIESTPGSRSATLPANFPSIKSMPSINERSQSTSTSQISKKPGNIQTSNSSGPTPLQGLENIYEGYLYKTKIVDVSKKKVKKSWAQIYVVLQGSNLVFYKDQKSSVQKQGSPYGKPEAVVSLVGARVDLNPKELTSKKNTILLSASAGNVYLFQSENEKDNLEWFTRMKIIADDVSPIDSSPRGFDIQDVQKDDKKAEKGMIRRVSADDNSNLHSIDKNKNLVGIRAKLYNLIARRPTQEDLYKRGIIKDAVFGSKLNELCEREKVSVPNFVQKCIAAVESKGLTHDGLYRVSGNLAEIQRLRFTVDTNDTYNLCDEQWDIHVLTGSLKLFFRELKEPVFPFNMYDRFVDAIKKETRKEKLSAFKSAVTSLPACNYATLKELFKHLCRVMDVSHMNRMQTQNIAIVFGPTLLWQQSAGDALAVQTVYQSRIVEFILLEYNELFK